VEWQNPTYAYLGVFVDELVRHGVAHVVICPGSRSTPLALSIAEQPALRRWVLVDERSAAFFALGLAKARQQPVILLCTSGTAAANFLPAIAEARQSRIPLIVLTADRPPELRDNGAPQTMDQLQLYGTFVKWFVEMATPLADEGMLRYSRTIAGRAVAQALTAPAGPVHLNFPLREPLIPAPIVGQILPPQRTGAGWQGRDAAQPFVQTLAAARTLPQVEVVRLARRLAGVKRGLLVVGPHDDDALAEPLTALAARLGFPILADPLARLRHGPHDHALIVDSYDAILRDANWVREVQPELVLRFGAMPTAKPLAQYLAAHPDCQQLVVDGGAGWLDPSSSAAQMIHADGRWLVEALLSELPMHTLLTPWAELWQAAQHTTRETLNAGIADFEPLFEGRVFTELAQQLPPNATLLVGNSMPIRDCDTFLGGTHHYLRVLGNRGVNGIDGLNSTALGLAAASTDPVVLVVGDLSFYHDLNGLLAAKRYSLNLTIVVVNNDGGGIFSFLPQADYPKHFEDLFGTPHGLDFAPVVAMYGGRFTRITAWDEFRAAVTNGSKTGGLHVIEVPTDRTLNVTLHRRLWPQVNAQLAALLAGTSHATAAD
jgi:2-succinyl-5-enolpyruvyl-6-hydroxy-3-cyclohexene-1-carboxylate synthase